MPGFGRASGFSATSRGWPPIWQSELVRDRVTAVFSGWTGAVEACIRDGQRKGEIPADWDAAVLASFLINAWEGAVLRTKVEKNGAAFEEFDQIVFGKLLQLEE